MRKDFFYGVILLILLGATLAPIPKNLSQVKTQTTTPNGVKPTSNHKTDNIDCSFTQDQSSDELASLTADQNQNSKVNSCLFLGCNGFF